MKNIFNQIIHQAHHSDVNNQWQALNATGHAQCYQTLSTIHGTFTLKYIEMVPLYLVHCFQNPLDRCLLN